MGNDSPHGDNLKRHKHAKDENDLCPISTPPLKRNRLKEAMHSRTPFAIDVCFLSADMTSFNPR